ncbi:MAG TPA: PfkB family carbohydrate kinase [Accumulibacter sp.]|uniref:PfkB family carbohydrate kinase n=1 Tax=Accumulibacter sp. TaxID=2053492 RepID=UPI002B7928ED|nr:PfkB family carbohydrate kinase [Accumulibacter sp.]HNC22445.1 PfkB family carbohydrate kinase [Accumulibacter sp.]HNF92690.1 PfkB family carbohydrate kinase [Accumulibacter sp.]
MDKSVNVFVCANLVMAYCWLVARLPCAAETLRADGFLVEPGGKGLNVAVGTRRLGAEVSALVGVGRDSGGRCLRDLFAAEGISTELVFDFDTPSGHGAGLIGANGENLIAVYPGANDRLEASHAILSQAAIAAADLVYGQFETSLGVLWECFRRARRDGVRTALNPSPWQPTAPQLLALCDILIVNEVEAQGIIGCGDLVQDTLMGCLAQVRGHVADFFRTWSGELLVLTLGSRGALAFPRAGNCVAAPAYPVTALDSIGAGDAFAAGLLYGLGAGIPLPDALDQANACGAFMAAHRGVLSALPTAELLRDFRRGLAAVQTTTSLP